MTSPFSIYILIGLTYPDYKVEPFAAYIDSGSGICLSKPACFPEEYHTDLPAYRFWIDDTLALDFFSASPDFENEQRFPVWHFIRMRKVTQERNVINNVKKIYKPFTEDNVHYRRGLFCIAGKSVWYSSGKQAGLERQIPDPESI